MSVARALLQSISQTISQFQLEGIPLVGLINRSRPWVHINAQAAFVTAFQDADDKQLDDGFRALRALQDQLRVLTGAEEHTREALQLWERLAGHYAQADLTQPLEAARAVEDGAYLVHQISKDCAPGLDLDLDDCHEVIDAPWAQQRLEELATAARLQAPQLFPAAAGTGGGGGGSRSGEAAGSSAGASSGQLLQQQLTAISRTLFTGEDRLKYEPVEWVYDHLSPALLPEMLRKKKGIPLTLGIAYAGVAARLGVPVALAKASQREAREAQEAAVRQQLPPELAQKQASRSGWVAPDPESWVLQAYQPAGSSSSGDASLHASLHAAAASPGPSPSPVAAALFVDVTAKGRLLSAQEASGAFPELAGLGELVSRSGDVGPSAVSAAQPPGLPLDASGRHVIGVWAELARTMVEAHQRRGESDMVAHWLYQLMALDPSAREWRHMLSAASAGIALKQQ